MPLFPFCAFTAFSLVNFSLLFSSVSNTRRRTKPRNKLILRNNMRCSGNTLPTFRDYQVLSSKVKNSSSSRRKPEITHNPEKLTVDWLTEIVHNAGPSLKSWCLFTYFTDSLFLLTSLFHYILHKTSPFNCKLYRMNAFYFFTPYLFNIFQLCLELPSNILPCSFSDQILCAFLVLPKSQYVSPVSTSLFWYYLKQIYKPTTNSVIQ